ncbi:MAG: PEGA domain-containing protein [Myxococcales bacterium]|nr:PEGA domain-containing protein [Myxococcales bacterium]
MTCASDRGRRAVARAVLLVALSAAAAIASPADDAFKEGRALAKAGKHAEACAAFETSQRLDPSFGTQFNIAQCDEKIGKLATALRLYRELAARDTNADRRAAAADLGAKLAPRVPRVQVQVTPTPAELTVTIDGVAPTCEPAPCTATPTTLVDLGSYEVVARAPGYREARATATVTDESRVVVVALQLVADAATPPPPPIDVGPVAAPRATAHSRRRTYAVVALAAGGAALVGGAVAGLRARRVWNDATAVCGGSTSCPSDADTARANQLADDARLRANISTALVIAGGVAVAGGVALWLTAPRERGVAVAAHASGDGGGVTLSGRF